MSAPTTSSAVAVATAPHRSTLPAAPDVTGAGPVPAARPARRPTLSLHGFDPESGVPVTWHAAPVADDGAPGGYVLERAEGDIRSPALWMQAQRQAALVDEADVVALVRAVMFDGAE